MKVKIFGDRREPASQRYLGDVALPGAFLNCKIRRILAAVDFSEGSRQALEFGAELAKKLGAEVVLLHVFEGVPGELKILEAAFVDTSFREQARQELAEWWRALASAGVVGKTVFRESASVEREIKGAARESGADLIVMGRHGRQGIERLFSSHTVSKVLSGAPCPVLLV